MTTSIYWTLEREYEDGVWEPEHTTANGDDVVTELEAMRKESQMNCRAVCYTLTSFVMDL